MSSKSFNEEIAPHDTRIVTTASDNTATINSARSSIDSGSDVTEDQSEHSNSELTRTPTHVFNTHQKRLVIYSISVAAIFSPLATHIYFPALEDVAEDLKVSKDIVAFTMTIYMIGQAVAPSFWGPLSDAIGRRPVYIGTFVVFVASNIGLVYSKSFAAFMVFRGIQAFGSSATVSIGAGVVGDITSTAERGGFSGVSSGIRNSAQTLGPVIGGILSQYLGYRSIFWFLFGSGALMMVLIIFFLPETLRLIAGNGDVRLAGMHKPWIYYIKPPSEKVVKRPACEKLPKMKISSFFSPLRFLFEKDVLVTLIFGSIVYAVWSMIAASMTEALQVHYHLNDLQVGLAFLAIGAGCMTGSISSGRLMDWQYKRTAERYRTKHNIEKDTKIDPKTHQDFPLEQARLGNTWMVAVVLIISTAPYGFALSQHLALPLILQFLVGCTGASFLAINNVLITDLYPGASASAVAVNNLVRFTISAGGVSVVQYVIDAIGEGYTFLIMAIITLMSMPLLFVELNWGGQWRRERTARLVAANASGRVDV